MKALALCCLLLIVAVSADDAIRALAKVHGSDPAWSEFVTFTKAHKRTYKTRGEADLRFGNFKQTLARNIELRRANPLATFGVNKFADWSIEEFRAKYLMPAGAIHRPANLPKFYASKAAIPPVKRSQSGAPQDIDWVDKGACTPVKDQGQCGSCWAFSATEATESACFVGGSGLPVLSPEQIVDCDTNDGGCNGGDPRSAMQYTAGAGGQDTEQSYPYTAGGGEPQENCTTGTVGATLSGPQDVSDGDESALQSFLQNSGPPSVCVDASSWPSYTGGVMTDCGCQLDHCVQAVGITSEFGTPAYRVRNSWASDWGVDGYIYLATGSNVCCVANEVSWVSGASAMAAKAKRHRKH